MYNKIYYINNIKFIFTNLIITIFTLVVKINLIDHSIKIKLSLNKFFIFN